MEDPAFRTATTIGLVWQEGTSNGGTLVIDYRIFSDNAVDNFLVIKSN